MFEAVSARLKLWRARSRDLSIKLRKTLILALLAPLFVSVAAPIPAQAATFAASDSYCSQSITGSTDVSVVHTGNSCVVIFKATAGNVTTSYTWTVPNNASSVSILVVGGGGSGGVRHGAGGGAGGYRYLTGVSVTPAGTVSISVGKGGDAAASTSGGSSGSNGNAGVASSFGTTSAAGGGFGGQTSAGGTGGSGGGGCCTYSGGSGNTPSVSPSQGNNGGAGTRGSAEANWSGGGGGGAGGAGESSTSTSSIGGAGDYTTSGTVTGGAGGKGISNDITGSAVCYAAGGGGGVAAGGAAGGAGGVCGSTTSGGRGGKGGTNTSPNNLPTQGVDGTGSGGGGAGFESTTNPASGRGGSGVVVVRYDLPVVTISANGGTGSPSATSLNVNSSNQVTLPTKNTLSRSGYTFGGWNTAADGMGTNYAESAVYTPTGNVTLYAQWRSAISYDANGGTSTRLIDSTTAQGSGATTTLSTGATSPGGVVTSGLQLYLDASNPASYPGSGSTWFDISGNGRNATALNSPTFDSVSKSFVLNGTNQGFEFANNYFAYSGTSPYTLAAMFKSSNIGKLEQCLICRWQNNVAGSYLLRTLEGVPESYRAGVASYPATGYLIGSSEYQYLVTTYDGSVTRTYLDGVQIRIDTNTAGNNASSTIKTTIGLSADSTRHLEGQLFSAQIYNTALNTSQVNQNYQALLPRSLISRDSSTLTGWSTTADSSTPVIVGNNGTLLAGLPTPYIRLEAKNYNGTTWTPTNYNGSGLTYSSIKPTLNSNQTGWGATGTFPTVSGLGSQSVGVYLNNSELNSYTFCAMARYKTNGISAPAAMGRIFAGTSVNWLSGWFSSGTKDFYHNGWQLSSSTLDYNWHYICDSGNNIYWDGVKLAVTNQIYTKFPAIAIGGGYAGGEWSDFEVSEVILYDQYLNSNQITQVNQYFKNTYGVVAGTVESATPNMVPPTNYASQGTSTLYARWGSTITYEGNGQTSGTPPAPQVFANGVGTLATNSGSLAEAGYNFVGWNTRADGTGTFYAPGASYSGPNMLLYAVYQAPVKIANTLSAADPVALSPYMRFKASDYDAMKKIWYDSSGNGRNTSSVRGDPTVVTTTVGNGSTKAFQVVSGGTTAGIKFNNPEMSSLSWTVFSVARYNGTQSGLSRIYDGVYGNFLFGFYNSASGVAHYGAWVTGASNVHGTNWVLSTGYTDAYRSNGVLRGTGNATDTLPPLTINAGEYVGSELSVWQVAETIIFNKKLSATEIQQVEDYLASTYGISGYTAQQSYSDSVTVNASAGSVTFSDTLTAILGYKNTFSISPTIPGITMEGIGTNQVRLRIANTVSTGTYWETITVTDTAGNSAVLPVRINVVPALQWSASNPVSVSSTFGQYTRHKLDLSGGFGTRVASVAHSSSPAPRGISIDTSTISSGSIYLIVDTGTAIGTYTESITVTDGSGLTKTTILTLTINSPPDIAYSAQTDAAYPYVTQNLLINLDAANPNSYSGSGTTWTDTASNRTFTLSGSPTYSQTSGGTLTFASGKEATSNTNWSNLETFTVETWFRLNSLSSAAPCFVTSTYASSHINFAICQWNAQGSMFAGYHVGGSGWQDVVGGSNLLVINKWYHAVYTVSKSGSTYTGTLYLNGVSLGSATSTLAPQTNAGPLRVGKRWDGTTEYIDGQIPVVRIYNAPLTAQQVLQNYQNSKVRFLSAATTSPTISGSTSLAVTAGTAKDFQLFTANDGTGTKTFTLSGSNSTFRIETSTANTAIFKVLASTTSTNTTTPKTYNETLTAVDTNGIATAYYLTVVANPAIVINSSTDTFTTTFGLTGSITLNVTSGTGTGTTTFTRISSSNSSAITASLTSGQAILSIAGTLPAGTYFETLTATDSIGSSAIKVLRIVVNPRLALVSDSGALTISTTYGKSKQLRLNFTGGTANFTYALNTVSSSKSWKFTLDTSTASSGYILFKADGYATIGTHTFIVSITDSVYASASVSISVTINENPRINNSPSTNSIVTSNLVTYLDATNSDSYPGSGTVWKDLSGNNGNFNFVGSPYYNSTGGGNISTTVGGYVLGEKNWNLLTSFTVESWFQFRYKNNPSVVECIISSTFTTTARNFSLCLASPTADTGKLRASYYANGERGVIQTPTELTTNAWYHAVYTVAQSGSNYTASLFLNGSQVGSSVSTTVAPAVQAGPLIIGKAYATTDVGAPLARIQTIRIYDRALNTSEINTNYVANLSRVNPDAAPSTTITTTQGGTVTSSAISSSLGSGNKTFTVSPDNSSSGVTIDTATANSVIMRADSRLAATDSQTARTYQQTLTATDEAGATTDYKVNVLVNPPIIETSTAPILTNSGGVITHVLTTTSGIETSTVIFSSKGASDKTFTRTGSAGSGASLTSNGNQATLRVLSTINPGTYWETVTATDTTTASTSLVFKIVVNPGPTIVGRTTLTATTRSAYTSPGYFVANGTGALKLTMSPDAAGISLDTSTAGIAYIKLTNAFTSTATYYETLTVADANGAIGKLAVTIKVVAPVTISGNTTVVSTYGDSNLFSYNVSGSAASYNVAVAGACITSKSTYSSGGTDYTVEQLLGATGSSTCEWVVPNGVTSVTGLLIAGGGQGGAGRGGGGGAGGVVTGTTSVTPGEILTIKVGAGGSSASCSSANSPAGCDGIESSISRSGASNWAVAQGGGGGGGHSSNINGRAGGSGGGAGMNFDSGNSVTNPPQFGAAISNTVPTGWIGYGFAGATTTDSETVAYKYRNTGGGGGAASTGFPGVCANKSPVCNNSGTAGGYRPDGGNAITLDITGVTKTYAGGGGGAVALGVGETSYLSAPAGNAYAGAPVDKGNAGVGATQSSPYGTNAAPNSGSGGGGSIGNPGGNGGSGLVVFRYTTPSAAQPNNRITFSLVDSATGRFNMTVPESISVGTYTQTVVISDASDVTGMSTNYTSALLTIKVIQDTPTATIALPGGVTTATYGSPVTLTSAVSANGKVTFKKGGTNLANCIDVISISGLATCTWTPNVVENALISAVLVPTDSVNYRTNIESDTALSISVGKADTLTVTANNLSLTYSEDGSGNVNTPTPSPSFKLTGLASIDSITAMSYSYSGLTYGGNTFSPLYQGTPSWAGMYTITPSSPVFASSGATSNYKNVIFEPGTLTINRAPRGSWTISYGSGTDTINYGSGKTETPTIVNRGDGTKLFSTSSSFCSVNSASGVITTVGVGTCSITAVLNQSDNWLVDTKTVTVTINRGLRTATLTPSSSTIRYGETTTVTASVLPLLDSATVTYSAGTSIGCQIDNVTGQVTGVKAGSSCGVSVLFGQTDLYESATATASVTINKAAAPLVTTETITAISYTGSSAIVSPTYRVSGILARDILQILPTANISDVSAIATSSYTAVDGYRYSATSPTAYDSTTAPSNGGTYQVSAYGLSLLAGADISNYETPTYVSADLVITPIAQSPLRILLSAQESITVPYDISISGGSSTGALSAVIVSGGSSTGCTVTGLRLSTTQPGSCVLMAIKAADRNYLQVVSETTTVVILNFVSSFNWDTVFSGTGITLTSEVPIVKGPETCSDDCVPTVSDITDLSGNSINTITVGTPFKIVGTNLGSTAFVYFTARIGGVRLSSVSADSFQIDGPTTLTVMAPVNFVPNAGENSSNINVRIVVLASGGSSFPNQQITIISL